MRPGDWLGKREENGADDIGSQMARLNNAHWFSKSKPEPGRL